MKKNLDFKNRLRKFVIVLSAISICVAVCTVISHKYGLDAYAEGTPLYKAEISRPETIPEIENGLSEDDFKSKIKKIQYAASGYTTASCLDPNKITGTTYASDVTADSYDEKDPASQTVRVTLKFNSATDNVGTSYFFDDNTKIKDTDTVNITVKKSPYTFVSVIDPEYEAVFPSKTSKDVITKALNENCPSVSIFVKTGSDTDTEEWTGVPVKWTGVKSGESYDPSSTDKQTVTWVGTVSKGSFRNESEGKNVSIPKDQTVEIKVIVGYDEYEESKMGGDYDDDDLGKIKTTISKSTVKKILDAQTDSKIKKTIEDAILDGKPLSIEVYVEKLDKDDVDDSIIDKFKDKADAKVGTICDIRLYLTVDGSRKNQITSPGQTLSFTHTIPSDLKKSSSSSNGKKYKRKFREYRYHDGSAHSCDEDWTDSDSPSSVKFKSSQFSYYALMYKDSETSSSSTSSSSRTGSSSIASARTPTTGGTTSGNAAGGSRTGSGAPKTGDEFNAKLWIYFLVVGVVVALCAFILYQDTKDWRDEKKEAK